MTNEVFLDTQKVFTGTVDTIIVNGTTVYTKPASRSITITPENYKTILQNISGVDFSGSNTEYFQVNKDHNMLAVPCDFKDVEIETEVYIVSCTTDYMIQLQSRTYTHPGTSPGNGAAYKGRFGKTAAVHCKEVVHTDNPNGYTSNKNDLTATYPNLIGRWSKLKFRTRNLPPSGTIIPVKLEGAVDGVTVSIHTDAGGWSCSSTHFASGGNCVALPRRQLDANGQLLTGYRKPSEIINTPLKWILVRSDGDCVYRCRYIKVTEILQ